MNSHSIARFRSHPAVARAAPFLIFIAFVMLGPAADFSAPGRSDFTYEWLVVARSAVVALALAWFWPAYGDLRKRTSVRAMHWLFAVAGGVAVFVLWIYFDHKWAVMSSGPVFDARLSDGAIHWPMALARLAGFAIVVPIMEELFWRSFILRWIERHDFLQVEPGRVGAKAFLITTVLFAFEHNQWFAGALAGAFYNWVYMRSGNLWVAVVAHGVTNAALGIWILYTGNWQFW